MNIWCYKSTILFYFQFLQALLLNSFTDKSAYVYWKDVTTFLFYVDLPLPQRCSVLYYSQ